MSDEIWKPVVDYEDLYEVSSHGRVRSIRYNKVMKPRNDKYYRIQLMKNGVEKIYAVHLLVLAAFRGPKPEGYQGRHLNGDKFDNRESNLQYGTASENEADKLLHGTDKRYGKSHLCKIAVDDVYAIRAMSDEGIFQRDIAKHFGISQAQVQRIIARKVWGYLP